MKISSKFSLALLAGTILSTPVGAADITELDEPLEIGRNESIDNIRVNIDNLYGIIYNSGHIGNIESTFTDNGNVIANDGEIDTIRSVFNNNRESIANYGLISRIIGSSFANNRNYYQGGAINSNSGGYIVSIIDSTFTGNTLEEPQEHSLPASLESYALPTDTGRGGALYLENIFINNVPTPVSSTNEEISSYTSITNSSFVGNHAVLGGAIFSSQLLNIKDSSFENNYNNANSSAAGGAIVLWTEDLTVPPTLSTAVSVGEHRIDNTDFVGNSSTGTGGAIAAMLNPQVLHQNYEVNISNSHFENNSASMGGAVYAMAKAELDDDDIDEISDRIDNMPMVNKMVLKNGDEEEVFTVLEYVADGPKAAAIYKMTAAEFDQYVKEGGQYYVTERTVDVTGISEKEWQQMVEDCKTMITESPEYVIDDLNQYKDALYTYEKADILSSSLTFTNTSFIGNKATTKGGAIYGSDVKIVADNGESLFSGNTAGGKSNAVYIDGAGKIVLDQYDVDSLHVETSIPIAEAAAGSLALETKNNGHIIYDDGIDGSNYNIDISGDSTGYVKFNNTVENVNRFTMNPGAIVHLGLNGKIYAEEFIAGSSSAVYARTGAKPLLTVDVRFDKATNTIESGTIRVGGDVSGATNVLVNALNSDVPSDKENAIVPFLYAPEDDENTSSSFNVSRVIGSPYMWHADKNILETPESGNIWYLSLTDTENPDYTVAKPEITPETVAYGALPAAALEQTRNMVDNIGGQVAATRTQDAAANYNLWVNPTYYTSNIDSPFVIDADIWGIEAGGDIQRDIHNRLGVFFSYRQGEYDMNGNGDKYRSPVGSEIDIDSYIAGLYYRYDNKNLYAFATLYGGVQEADIKTDDGMKSDTDGVEFGASAEVGYDYALTDSVTLTPELGVFYTQVNYDDASDNVGKSASYDDARQIELEAGVKLARTFMLDEGFASVYVKPSVVQTIVDGDEVSITGLGDVEALDDATLGRIEIGGRYGFTTNLSAYGWANYTFGSDYDATTFGLGLNYAF